MIQASQSDPSKQNIVCQSETSAERGERSREEQTDIRGDKLDLHAEYFQEKGSGAQGQRQHAQVFQGHRVETRDRQTLACMMMVVFEMQEVESESESESRDIEEILTGRQETRR